MFSAGADAIKASEKTLDLIKKAKKNLVFETSDKIDLVSPGNFALYSHGADKKRSKAKRRLRYGEASQADMNTLTEWSLEQKTQLLFDLSLSLETDKKQASANTIVGDTLNQDDLKAIIKQAQSLRHYCTTQSAELSRAVAAYNDEIATKAKFFGGLTVAGLIGLGVTLVLFSVAVPIAIPVVALFISALLLLGGFAAMHGMNASSDAQITLIEGKNIFDKKSNHLQSHITKLSKHLSKENQEELQKELSESQSSTVANTQQVPARQNQPENQGHGFIAGILQKFGIYGRSPSSVYSSRIGINSDQSDVPLVGRTSFTQ